jgi:LmbE family N-acetylglucosaminyl deacetylase
MKTIMAIGAHVGDMELTAGGVLATEALRGNRIITVALTAGEKGNPSSMSVAEYRGQKVREAEETAALMNGRAIVLDTPDGLLKVDDETIWSVVDIIRREHPDILITHWRNSVHKDHAACHQIVTTARYYAANAGFERELPAHPCSKIFFAENLEDQKDFKPFIYVDIKDGYALWKKAVLKHWFVTHSSDHKYWDYYDALSICRGAECHYDRAETFMVRDQFDHVDAGSILEF